MAAWRGKEFLSLRPSIAWRLLALLPFILVAGLGYAFFQVVVDRHFFKFVQYGYPFLTIVYPSILLCTGAVILFLGYWNPLGQRLRLAAWGVIVLGFCCIGVRIYATHIEPYRLEVVEQTIVSPKIHTPLKVVHLTDVQSAQVGEYEERVFRIIRELHPDLILNTGDNLQPVAPATLRGEQPKLDRLFRSVQPPLGIVAVEGNVCDGEIYAHDPGFGGQRVLADEAVLLSHGRSRLHILGLSVERSVHPDSAIDQWMAAVSPEDFTVVMGHVPDYMLEACLYPIDLCLAGHTHGGQIVVPGFGPLITFSALPRHLVGGFHPFGETYINVSKGVGAEHCLGIPSIRFFCRPDITVFHLIPQGGAEIVEEPQKPQITLPGPVSPHLE